MTDAISNLAARAGDPQLVPSAILVRVEVGDVLLIDDAITGFDRNKPERPCMVVKVEAPPRAGGWVVPRSTQGSVGTLVPRGAMPGLNKDGRFQFLPRWVSASDLAGCRSLGALPDPYRTRVLDNANIVVAEVEIDL